MKVKIAELRELADKALRFYGYSASESTAIAEMLFYAQLRGNNQGLVKLIGRGIPKSPDAGEITTVKETKLSTLLNGNQNPGAVVMTKAVQIATEKASEHGFAIVGTNNTSSSTGAIGHWARKVASSGCIGLVFAGSPETVTTQGSYQPLFGTNPLAIAVPTTGEPLVLDMATAAIAYFGLVEAKTAGRKIPDNLCYDAEGNVTTDPGKAMDGSIMPFDKSYKGAGLAMMVEVLTGPLVAASFIGIGPDSNWGNLVIAIDPGLLVDADEFKKQVTQLAEKVRSAKKLPGVGQIVTPGQRGDELTAKHLAAGEIEIEENLYNGLKAVAQKAE